MRKVITWEGEEKIPTIIIEHGALWWEKKKIPIDGLGRKLGPVGFATDLQREDDGSITAELTFFDTEHEALAEASEISFSVAIKDLEGDLKSEVRRLTAGQIFGAFATTPDMVAW